MGTDFTIIFLCFIVTVSLCVCLSSSGTIKTVVVLLLLQEFSVECKKRGSKKVADAEPSKKLNCLKLS